MVAGGVTGEIIPTCVQGGTLPHTRLLSHGGARGENPLPKAGEGGRRPGEGKDSGVNKEHLECDMELVGMLAQMKAHL